MNTILAYLHATVECAFWFLKALLLIVSGFAIDGTSAAGHHPGLNLGGICVGVGLSRAR